MAHWEVIRASIGIEEIRTPAKANRSTNPHGITTPATSSMSRASAESAILVLRGVYEGVEKLPFHSREWPHCDTEHVRLCYVLLGVQVLVRSTYIQCRSTSTGGVFEKSD